MHDCDTGAWRGRGLILLEEMQLLVFRVTKHGQINSTL